MNQNEGGCSQCAASHRELSNSATGMPGTSTCFAGMRETLIPVRSGERTFAMLSIGQVFTTKPGKTVPAEVRQALGEAGFSPEDRKSLEESWKVTRVLPVEQYQGMVTLLAAFALQLADILNRLLIEEANAEPEVVVKAKRFVNAHLEDKISLESVAQHVGVSPYYFCKVFKQSAGMTLTEFVNRRRVEWAKRKLLNPQARVTEVAFDVGFQSISQFNRSFLKYVGESPTRFRENQESATRLREMNAA
jgi:AraC-like DNA-binding protein